MEAFGCRGLCGNEPGSGGQPDGRGGRASLPTGSFIGFVGLCRPGFEAFFTPCVEIGWRLRREAWGFGYATEGAGACLAYGFRELGLDRIYAFTAVDNARSERVMQKIGMGKLGAFDHPKLEEGHWLRRHVVYHITS